MLGAGGDSRWSAERLPLKPLDLGPGHRRPQEWVFAGPFDHPAPPGIASHIDHRGEGPADSRRPCLARADGRGFTLDGRVPATRHRQRDRQDRPIPVDHVEAENDRNLEPGFRDGDPLDRVDPFRAVEIEDGSHLPPTNHIENRVPARPQRKIRAHLLKLSDLFLDRHAAEERIDPLREPGRRFLSGRTSVGTRDRKNKVNPDSMSHGCIRINNTVPEKKVRIAKVKSQIANNESVLLCDLQSAMRMNFMGSVSDPVVAP